MSICLNAKIHLFETRRKPRPHLRIIRDLEGRPSRDCNNVTNQVRNLVQVLRIGVIEAYSRVTYGHRRIYRSGIELDDDIFMASTRCGMETTFAYPCLDGRLDADILRYDLPPLYFLDKEATYSVKSALVRM